MGGARLGNGFGGNYFGPTLNRTGRLRDAAHGGQIVLSLATAELIGDALPDGVQLVDLGAHALRGMRFARVRLPMREGDTPRAI